MDSKKTSTPGAKANGGKANGGKTSGDKASGSKANVSKTNASKTNATKSARTPVPWHALRLGLFALGGVIAGLLAPSDWQPLMRILIGWDVAAFLYIASVSALMLTRSDPDSIARRAAEQDDGALVLFLLTIAAAALSFVAIFMELASAKQAGGAGAPSIALAIATVILSWTLCHTSFAVHYAHSYYGGRRKGSGLDFPGDDKPDYWDFVYFSFVIGMTFQVSDVEVEDKMLRRLVVAHGALSFFFNTAIIALMVNITANAF